MSEIKQKPRVVVAMSGGVDSSVAALLLCRQGFDVVGMSMRLWSYEKEAKHGCCTPEDLYDARRVAEHLNIPYYVTRFEESFEEKVVQPFVDSYLAGETPNPCVRCNTDIKFNKLLTKAKELDATFLATGHYAKIVTVDGVHQLLRPKDLRRDQSYFLYGLTQEELAQTLFPLADYTKDEIRAIAREAGLPVADKPDSQEICFVPDSYDDFVKKRSKDTDIVKGQITDESGKKLADHDGIHQFTVGQRRGLGISSELPMYVLSVENNGDVRVGENSQLFKQAFTFRELRWTHRAPKVGDTVLAKIRSRFEPAAAVIESVTDKECVVRFDQAQRAITKGQAAVIYSQDSVLGGGWISSVF